jgi:hypothetical protein
VKVTALHPLKGEDKKIRNQELFVEDLDFLRATEEGVYCFIESTIDSKTQPLVFSMHSIANIDFRDGGVALQGRLETIIPKCYYDAVMTMFSGTHRTMHLGTSQAQFGRELYPEPDELHPDLCPFGRPVMSEVPAIARPSYLDSSNPQHDYAVFLLPRKAVGTNKVKQKTRDMFGQSNQPFEAAILDRTDMRVTVCQAHYCAPIKGQPANQNERVVELLRRIAHAKDGMLPRQFHEMISYHGNDVLKFMDLVDRHPDDYPHSEFSRSSPAHWLRDRPPNNDKVARMDPQQFYSFTPQASDEESDEVERTTAETSTEYPSHEDFEGSENQPYLFYFFFDVAQVRPQALLGPLTGMQYRTMTVRQTTKREVDMIKAGTHPFFSDAVKHLACKEAVVGNWQLHKYVASSRPDSGNLSRTKHPLATTK